MERIISKNNSPYIDQIKSASFVLEIIRGMGSLPDDLSAVRETDVYRLRRGLCLPAAACACINKVLGYRLIGDDDRDTQLTLGDFFKLLLPFHGRSDFSTSYNGSVKSWRFATQEGNVYHQAVVAFSEGVGVSALAVGGFQSVGEFQRFYLDPGAAMSISLDNRFVLDHTLMGSPNLVKKIGDESYIFVDSQKGIDFRKFENGRHVVFIQNISGDGLVTIYDSFRLPQMKENELIIQLPSCEVDKYLNYSLGGAARGILFAKNRSQLTEYSHIESKVWVPDEIVNQVRKSVSQGTI